MKVCRNAFIIYNGMKLTSRTRRRNITTSCWKMKSWQSQLKSCKKSWKEVSRSKNSCRTPWNKTNQSRSLPWRGIKQLRRWSMTKKRFRRYRRWFWNTWLRPAKEAKMQSLKMKGIRSKWFLVKISSSGAYRWSSICKSGLSWLSVW